MSKKNKKKLLIISGAVLIPLLAFLIYIYSLNTPGWGFGLSNPSEQALAQETEPQVTGEETVTSVSGGEVEADVKEEQEENKVGREVEQNTATEPSKKREILFKGLEENIRIYNGCYADIRIRYANGEEYTVLKNVKLIVEEEKTPAADGTSGATAQPQDENTVYLIFTELDELELLYYSSALTDCVLYAETTLIPAIVKGAVQEDSTGNYRPVKEVLTLISEEGFLESEKADELFLARERLEERLLSSSVYYREAIKDALINGITDGGSGYWMIN